MLGKIELSVGETDKLFLPIPGTNFSRQNPANPPRALANFTEARRSSQPTKAGFSFKVDSGKREHDRRMASLDSADRSRV
jgi:hypothetical protein